MSSFRELISIGFDKNGDATFRVSMAIRNLSPKTARELRAIVPVAIACAEEHICKNHPDVAVAGQACSEEQHSDGPQA